MITKAEIQRGKKIRREVVGTTYDSELQNADSSYCNRSRGWLKSKESACTKIKCSSIWVACQQNRHRKLLRSKRRES